MQNRSKVPRYYFVKNKLFQLYLLGLRGFFEHR